MRFVHRSFLRFPIFMTAVHAAAPHKETMKIGFSWEGYALPNPPRGRVVFWEGYALPNPPVGGLFPGRAQPSQTLPAGGLFPGRAEPSPTLPGAGCFLGGYALPNSPAGGLFPGRAEPSQTLPTGRGVVRQAHHRWGNPVSPYVQSRILYQLPLMMPHCLRRF